MHILLAFLAISALLGCSSPKPKDPVLESQKLNQFLDQTFDEFLSYSPEGLAYFGKKEKYDQLNDYTEAFDQKMLTLQKQKLEQLKNFDRASLDPQAQLSYDLFQQDLEKKIKNFQWKDYGYAVNQQSGVHTELPVFMINIHKVDNEKDLQDYIARLHQFKRVFSEVEEQIQRSEKQGVVPPRFVFPAVFEASQNVISGKPFDPKGKDSPLLVDFKAKLKKLKLSAAKNKKYLAQTEEALLNSVKPAYESLIAKMKDLEKRATQEDGAWKFPRGDVFYKSQLQRYTTTNMTADEIHELGLKNVERLRNDMLAIKDKMGFKGTLPEFFVFMRKDPQQYYAQTEAGKKEYLAQANQFRINIEKKIPLFFRLIPKTKMEIKPVEKFREAAAGKAFYESPSDDGIRPGVYYVNLQDLKNAPKFESEALFYHEGVPGHHFQIALGIELKDLPKTRRYGGHTAFVEGWALYTERLAKEMGGYQDLSSELGRLSMEMVRACRLVVDTGIHAKKWTREKAIQYMSENLPVSAGMQTEQVERYIIWPGQATAYMVGMLKIYQLREYAKKELGDKFDIRDFHDVVLGNGSVNLELLERLVKNYVVNKKQV